MKIKLLNMKNVRRWRMMGIAVVAALLLSTNQAWGSAHGYTYAYGENYNKYEGTAKGKVYVSTTNSTPESSAYKIANYASSSYSSSNNSAIATGYVFAKAEPGWEFQGWIEVASSSTTQSTTGKSQYEGNHVFGDYTGSYKAETNTLTVQHNDGDSGDHDRYAYYRAHFEWDGVTAMDAPTFGFNKEEKYTRKVPIPVGSTYTGVENNGAFSFYGYVEDSRFTVTFSDPTIAHYDKTKNAIIADKVGETTVTIAQPAVYKNDKLFINATEGVTQLIKVIPDEPSMICEIEDTRYTFADALAFANNHPDDEMTILVIKDGTVPAGYYTLPKKATLLIPYDVGQYLPATEIERVNGATIPSVYRTLTLAEGVHLDVFGTIEIGGKQNNNTTAADGVGRPSGSFHGLMVMQDKSDIILENGATLRAWGFITGKGEIDARRGSIVKEQFQIYDFKGGSTTCVMLGNDEQVFPVMEYFIQNIEVPVTYRPGSALWGITAAAETAAKVKLVGIYGDEASMFLMDNEDDSEDTWVKKWYDPVNDKQIYQVNNSAGLGNLKLELGSYTFNSADYILPITHNMKIHLLSGKLDITQSTELLPGAEIEIDKKSTVSILKDKTLYLIDTAQWGKFIYSNTYAQRIKYRPGGVPARDISTRKALGQAKLNIHGTFDVKGALYTTEGGANIYSTNDDAGTIIYSNAAGSSSNALYEISKIDYASLCGSTVTYTDISSEPAILRNEDGEHPTTSTSGTPGGQSYCYIKDKWTMMTVDPDSSCFMVDNYGVYYAKPGDYVAISATKDPVTKKITGNPDHTYNDAAGTGRLFILTDGCQWWEVENVDNLYHCLHPQNNTYYEWVDDVILGEEVITPAHWAEKRFVIKWNNWDGQPVLDANDNPVEYMLTYGTTPKFLSTNPTRPADPDAIYTFTGWTPAFEPVTGDKTYTATYSKETRRYDILFKYVDGGVIERQFLQLGAIPECSEQAELEVEKAAAEPGKTYILTWDPALSAVTGDAVYTAKWIDVDNNPGPFTITFKNYDNTDYVVLTEETAVTKNSRPNPGDNPTRPATSEYTFEFSGWKATDGNTYSALELPFATMDAVYTAVFTPTAKTYTVNFYKEGTTDAEKDEEHLIASSTVLLGADPEVPEYEKANTAQYTYWLEWENMETGEVGVGVPSVSGNADYVATFREEINRYKLNLISNQNSLCSFVGAGVYDYNTNVDVSVTVNDPDNYLFEGWSDGVKTTTRRVNVRGDMELCAVIRDLTITESLVADPEHPATAVSGNEYYNVIISSNGTTSGELTGDVNDITLWGNAYFDLTPNGDEGTHPRAWYAVAVPWQVDARTGVYNKDREKALGFGTEFDILYYDGKLRQEEGPVTDCWHFLEHDEDKTMYPGRLYMIHFTQNFKTIRFQKKARTDIGNTEVEIVVNTGNEEDPNANWNGIANPTTHKVDLTITGGVHWGAKYGGGLVGEDFWIVGDLDNMIVGEPVMVQVKNGASVVTSTPAASSIRRRARQAKSEGEYAVEIYADGRLCDRIYVDTDEEKPNHYLIGKDLVKPGVSAARAQMWIDRYEQKLSVNTIAPTNNTADYPLSIYAPHTGDYTIEVAGMSNNETNLYLTLDGEAIWNLSTEAFVASLEQGTTKRYGLRISDKNQSSTGVDEAIVDAKDNVATKVLINNEVYIIRGNEVYTVSGTKIK